LGNRLAFKTFINKTLFEPAKKRLRSDIPQATKERVIVAFTKDNFLRAKIRTVLSGRMSYKRFRDTFRDKVDQDKVSHLEGIIDVEFSKITLTKKQLTWILKDLHVEVENFHDLFDALPTDPVLPYTLACKLRLLLIDHKVAIIHPYEIEISICKAAGLPLPIEVGDLNYYDYDREDPGHRHVVVDIAWRDRMPHYFQRDSEVKFIQPNRSYTSFKLQHPRIQEQDKPW
jgi:hypothetical protein